MKVCNIKQETLNANKGVTMVSPLFILQIINVRDSIKISTKTYFFSKS